MKEITLLSTKDLIDKYGVTKQAISKWRNAGMGYYKLSKRVIVYDPLEVERWLKQSKSKLVD